MGLSENVVPEFQWIIMDYHQLSHLNDLNGCILGVHLISRHTQISDRWQGNYSILSYNILSLSIYTVPFYPHYSQYNMCMCISYSNYLYLHHVS